METALTAWGRKRASGWMPEAHRALVACVLLLFPVQGDPYKAAGKENQENQEKQERREKRERHKLIQLRANYLRHFCGFIQWPKSAFKKPTDPIVIAVIGEAALGRALTDAVGKKKVHGRPLRVEHICLPDEKDEKDEKRLCEALARLRSCHMLYVCESQRRRLPKILESLKGAPILTVSDIGNFTGPGKPGMIEFYVSQNKLRFKVNPVAAKKRGIEIKSSLLSLAKIVKENKK